MNNKLLLSILLVLVLPLVASQTYKTNDELNLKVPFEVNGSMASVNADCNISIDYPNGSYFKENESMTNLNNGDFNITLLGSELTILGEYKWRAFCCDVGQCAAGYGSFELTPSGSDAINSGEGLTLSLSIIAILILAVLFFIFSFKVMSFPVKVIFMGTSLVLFVIVLLFTMITLQQILGGFSSIISSYSSFFWASLFLFFLVFIFLMLCLIKQSVEALKIKRGLV